MQLGPMVYPGQHYKIARVSECVSILKEREEKKRIEAEERERERKKKEKRWRSARRKKELGKLQKGVQD